MDDDELPLDFIIVIAAGVGIVLGCAIVAKVRFSPLPKFDFPEKSFVTILYTQIILFSVFPILVLFSEATFEKNYEKNRIN